MLLAIFEECLILVACDRACPMSRHVDSGNNVGRFAQNEFEHGSVERGRTVFEGLMASYPKRLDLWNVYLDKEVKCGDLRAARNLQERLVSHVLVELTTT